MEFTVLETIEVEMSAEDSGLDTSRDRERRYLSEGRTGSKSRMRKSGESDTNKLLRNSYGSTHLA